MNDNEPPLWDYQYRYILYICFVLLLLFLMASLVLAQKPLRTQSDGSQSLSDCFIEGPRIPYIPQVETYGAVVDRLIECESGGNPEALGDDGRAHGVLQFHDPTFQRYCVERYGYRDDIWDEDIQRQCCLEMLNQNFDNVSHWTCFKLVH